MIAMEIKLAAVGLAICGAACAVLMIPEHYINVGREQVHKENAEAARRQINQRRAENERDSLIFANKASSSKKDIQHEIDKINEKFQREVAAAKSDGFSAGLRFKSSSVCTSGSGGTAKVESASDPDGTRIDRLPRDIEFDLRSLTAKCNKVQAKLTTLQKLLLGSGVIEVVD